MTRETESTNADYWYTEKPDVKRVVQCQAPSVVFMAL